MYNALGGIRCSLPSRMAMLVSFVPNRMARVPSNTWTPTRLKSPCILPSGTRVCRTS